jgi:ABC-type polysaccharide/polyol phosphate transport system ATPase subunit
VIEIIHVSKKFRIWEDRSRDLKETTINFLRGKKRSFRELWALRELNLEIREGETVAFIGENGSGKSTLLKLLGSIYMPDEGKIVTQGKISSLLELGVGFHPDLTGEENIYLNGAMLGFNRSEMKRRFDEIVSFSEIGDFIYSPIRTYSSGMLMRLGFSVAMCVDPDILLIDEILAVGDEAFQKKCLERLEEFKSAGKTIVIVSHALDLIKKFCERAILLHEGRLVTDGNPEGVIDKYHAILSTKERPPDLEKLFVEEIPSQLVNSHQVLERIEEEEREKGEVEREESNRVIVPQVPEYKRSGTLEAEITDVVIRGEKGQETVSFTSGDLVSICLNIRFHRDIKNPAVGILITTFDNGREKLIYSTNTLWRNIRLGAFKEGMDIKIDFNQSIPLPEGRYYLNVGIANSDVSTLYDWHEHLKCFQIKKAALRWEGTVDLNSQIILLK